MPKTQELTISKATAQARRLVDKIMPGAMATVESKRCYDLAADRATIVTTITYPIEADRFALAAAIWDVLDGKHADVRGVEVMDTRTIVTRGI